MYVCHIYTKYVCMCYALHVEETRRPWPLDNWTDGVSRRRILSVYRNPEGNTKMHTTLEHRRELAGRMPAHEVGGRVGYSTTRRSFRCLHLVVWQHTYTYLHIRTCIYIHNPFLVVHGNRQWEQHLYQSNNGPCCLYSLFRHSSILLSLAGTLTPGGKKKHNDTCKQRP